MKRLLLPMMFLACAGPQKSAPVQAVRETRDVEARRRVTEAVARLPSCAPDVATARLQFDGACTLKACPGVVSRGVATPAPACCNTCGWNASLVNASGMVTPVATKRVVDLFGIYATPYDCELKVWREVVEVLELSLNEPVCVVRK